jgi:hypothetical protein
MNKYFFSHIRQVRLLIAMFVAFIFFAICDYGVNRLDRLPHIVLRNENRSHSFTPYFFKQMRLCKDRPVIAWFGASVVQGFQNTTPERAVPIRLQDLMETGGHPVRAFNLAVVQNNLGDHLGLMSESIRQGADLLVMPLHFKLFSERGTLGMMTLHKDTSFYLRGRKDFTKLRRKLLRVTDKDWSGIRLRKNLEMKWDFYRQRGLISYLLTGQAKSPPHHFRTWFFSRIASGNEVLRAYKKKPNYKARNKKNIWRKANKSYHKENSNCYSSVKLELENHHFVLLKLINELRQGKAVKLLFYATPLNRMMNDKQHYWTWDRHAKFIEMTKTMALEHDNLFVDMTDAVDNKHFTDGDHLTMKGHDELARSLYPHILSALDERP